MVALGRSERGWELDDHRCQAARDQSIDRSVEKCEKRKL
jgi:hypothetical protein